MRLESKLFCLLIIGFLYIFQKKNFQQLSKVNYSNYFFTFAGILFSITEGIATNVHIKNISLIGCLVCYVLAAFFLCKNVFEMVNGGKPTYRNCVMVLSCIVIGVVTLFSSKYSINTDANILTFGIIISFVIAQYNKIRIDNLTKLYNRYGMDAELREQLRQYEREHSDSFYIIACDLDNFKHINDTWGHLEGDRALILIANVLSEVGKMFNSNVFRIGGDEFVIITDTSEKGLAVDITNAVKNELDKIEFRDDFDIKMSIGVALYDGVTSINELLNNADKKLYEAKKSKR